MRTGVVPSYLGRVSRPRMRPEFVLPLTDSARFWETFERTLEARAGNCLGMLFRQHAVLQMNEQAQHFWSPHLYLELRDADEHEADDPVRGGPHLHGRFAPHPHVWTMFMALYGLIILGGIACGVWGLSVWTLGEAPWILLGVPAAAGVFAFVYGAAFIGQGLGAEQMYEQRRLVDRAMRKSGQTQAARDSIEPGPQAEPA